MFFLIYIVVWFYINLIIFYVVINKASISVLPTYTQTLVYFICFIDVF